LFTYWPTQQANDQLRNKDGIQGDGKANTYTLVLFTNKLISIMAKFIIRKNDEYYNDGNNSFLYYQRAKTTVIRPFTGAAVKRKRR